MTMEEKIENQLTDVPETMLITLWAKATETQRSDALLRDEKAAEIIQKIAYDFSKFEKAKFSQAGCCIRASLIDQEVKAFIAAHPNAVAIQLGAGLDARFQRLGRPTISHWYDLDLPQAIDLRRKLIEEGERNTYLATSLFEYEWLDTLKAENKPIIIIIEGVLMYFAPEQVKALFNEICTRLGNATVVFDMLAYSLVGHAKKHDTLSKVDDRVEFRWSLLDSKEMESWNKKIHLEKEYYMSDYDHGRYPTIFRFLYKFRYFYRRFNQRVVRLHIG